MATKSIPQSKSTIEYIGKFVVTENYVTVSDPCYLTDREENLWLMAIPFLYKWCPEEEFGTANIFEVRNSHGNRALVLCTHDSPPAVLMDKKLTGNFYIAGNAAVDSGQIGFFNENFIDENEDKEFEEYEKNSSGYWSDTYSGDGAFLIVVWADNGIAHTVAILTDMEYLS